MGSDQRIITSRTIPPRTPADLVERPELLDRALSGLDHGLLLVVAGAGYGKTTLLGQVAAALGDCCWLSLDRGVDEPGLLAAHLAEAVARVRPGFGADLDFSASAEILAADLSNELAAFGDLTLIVDDVHEPGDPGVIGLLDLVLAHRPPPTRIALGGRSLPELPRAAASLLRAPRIEDRHLAMSVAEAGRLLAAPAAGELAGVDVGGLVARTEGWVTGLVLLLRHGLDGPSSRGADALFSYLADQVLARLAPPEREQMRRLALLERFDAGLARALTGRDDADRLIRSLEGRHLFVERSTGDDPWFRLHALMREHLARELAETVPAETLRELHRAAAAEWQRRGEELEACRHHLQADERIAAAEALGRASETLVDTRRMSSLGPWLRRFDRAEVEGRIPLLVAGATVAYGQGRTAEAYADLELAAHRYLEAGRPDEAALALHRLLHAMTVAGAQPRLGVRAAERLLPRLDPGRRATAAARLGYAARLGHDCRFDRAEEQIALAEATPAAAAHGLFPSYIAVTRAYYVDHLRGGTVAAIDALEVHAGEIDRSRAADDLVMLGPAWAYLSVLLNRVGRFEDALAAVDRMREVMDSQGAAAAALGPSGWPRAVALCGLGRFDEAEGELRRARALIESATVTAWSYRFLQPAARIAAERGDAEAVRGHIAAARAALAGFGFSFDRPQVLLDLALACDRTGMAPERDELLREAARAAQDVPESVWVSARVALARAVATADAGERGRLAAAAVSASAGHDLGPVWDELTEDQVGAVLAACLAAPAPDVATIARIAGRRGEGAMRPVVRAVAALDDESRRRFAAALRGGRAGELAAIDLLLRDGAPEVRAAAADSRAAITRRHRARISIATFGGLVVRRDGVPVPDQAFGRRRSRELLAALICAGGSAERDLLTAWLWPELGAAQAARALRTTLHELRRALQPELISDEDPDWIVASAGTALVLRLGPGDALDLELVGERDGAPPPGDLERLRAAESAAAGEFLPDFAYEDWRGPAAAAARDRVSEIVASLAAALLDAGEPRAAAERYRRLLAADPEREDWHRGLMRAYAAAGERGRALRQYHECRARLAESIGAPPSEATEHLFRELLG